MRNAGRGRSSGFNGRDLQRVIKRFETSMSAWSYTAAARLRRTTPRERMLLAVLILGALLYTPVAALGWRADQEDRYIAAMIDRAAARTERNAAQRVAAAANDVAAIEDMRSWGFEGSNPAILQIRIEQRLREAATRAQLQNVQIDFDSEIETVGPTRWVTATVQGDLRWTPTFTFMDQISAWPEGFRVTSFAFDRPPPTPGLAEILALNPNAVRNTPTGRVRVGLAFPVALDSDLAS